jgi:hypothetical protein
MRESDIENYLVKRVKAMGGEVRKVQWIGRVGAPDRLVMLPLSFKPMQPLAPDAMVFEECIAAKTIWVELKAPGAKPRPSQLREHDRMRAMGQHVVVIDSLEGVEALLS